MGLKEDIKQKSFKNPFQKAALNVIYTSNWLDEKIRCFLDEECLTPQQYNVLRILRGSHPEPLSTLQIRERMLDKMSDTSRIVDRLVCKNLATKNTCRGDKRLVDISIEPSGLELLTKIDQKNRNLETYLSNLSPEEATKLSDLLDKVRG